MSTVSRRAALGLGSLVVAVSSVLALGGTASAAIHLSAQCPSGYQLNPNNTQECTPVGSPSDSQSSVPPGSQTTDTP